MFQELLSLSKKKKAKQPDEAIENNAKSTEKAFTDSDTSDSDDDWDARGTNKKKKKQKPAKRTGKRTVTKSSSGSESDSGDEKSSEPEEGKTYFNCIFYTYLYYQLFEIRYILRRIFLTCHCDMKSSVSKAYASNSTI